MVIEYLCFGYGKIWRICISNRICLLIPTLILLHKAAEKNIYHSLQIEKLQQNMGEGQTDLSLVSLANLAFFHLAVRTDSMGQKLLYMSQYDMLAWLF